MYWIKTIAIKIRRILLFSIHMNEIEMLKISNTQAQKFKNKTKTKKRKKEKGGYIFLQ